MIGFWAFGVVVMGVICACIFASRIVIPLAFTAALIAGMMVWG